MNFLIGQVIQASGGKANPKIIKEILIRRPYIEQVIYRYLDHFVIKIPLTHSAPYLILSYQEKEFLINKSALHNPIF